MHKTSLASLLLGTALALAPAVQAAMVWRPAPPQKHQHGSPAHDRHAPRAFSLLNGDGAQTRLITPTLQSVPLDGQGRRYAVKPTGNDNYHVLVAQRRQDNLQEAAIRYLHFSGKPSGHSPAELTAYAKTDFDIAPDPLPREHRHYQGRDAVAFRLRLKGAPLAGVEVSLGTSNGGWLKARSDARGRVRFTLPDDFPDVQPGRRANRPGDFTVSAKYAADGQSYLTTISAPYYPNPSHWQSTGLAVAVSAGGFAAGALVTGLGRRPRDATGKGGKH
jgi:hypothetical protein